MNSSPERSGSSPWRIALRLAVTGVLLALAFRLVVPPEGESLVATLLAAWTTPIEESLAWFGLAFAIFGVGFAIGALRFQILLRGAGLTSRWANLLRAYLVATFVNTLVPGGVLGDVYRFIDARRETGQGSEVAGIVALERLLSLAALGGIGLMVAPFIPLGPEQKHFFWLLIVGCTGLVLAAVASLHRRVNAFLRQLAARLAPVSARLAEIVDRALAAVAELAAQPSLVTRVLVLSVVMQWLPVVATLALAAPLDANVAWHWIAVIVPFVTLLSLLPISVGGAGIREVLYVTLFGAVGMRAEVALSLSLSVYIVAIAWALIGLVAFRAGPRSPGSSPSAELSDSRRAPT